MSNMESNPNDQKVIDLLSKLKASNGAYPSEILAARRQTYLRQVANVGLGIGVGAVVKNAAKGGNGAAGTAVTVTSKILELALIAAIAVEAGAAAYLYRGKIADLVRTYTNPSNVQEVTFPAGDESSSSVEAAGSTEVPAVVTLTTLSGTITVTSGTPSPAVAGDNTNSSNNNGSTTTLNATPDPGGNNGNQFGLTPKPERTKDPGNDNKDNKDNTNDTGGSNNGNNNKP